MPTGKGFDSLCAIAKSVTWGLAVSVNSSGKAVKMVSEGITTAVEYIPDESLAGSPWKQKYDIGKHSNTGPLDFEAKYYGLELLIAMAMFRADTPVRANKQPAGRRPYAYYMNFRLPLITTGTDTDGYFFTLAIDKSISVWEYDSAKINTMQISGEAGKRVRFQFGVMARRMRNTGQVNTTLGSATEPLPRLYIVYSDAKFRMNAQSAAALDNSTDQFYPASFELTLTNGLNPDPVTAENDPYIDEPTRDAFGSVEGSFTIPNYKNDTNVNSFLAGTVMKADIKMISSTQIPAVGGGSYYYAMNIYMPQVQVKDAARTVSGPGRIPGNFAFEATKADAAPSGMTGTAGLANTPGDNKGSRKSVTAPMVVEIMGVQKTAVL